MTDYEDILRRVQLAADSAGAWVGTVYRNSTVRFSSAKDLLTGEGSRKYGGRWNPKGAAAVYASLTPEAAMAEALGNFRYYGHDIAAALPRVFVAVDISLERVLDLTEGSIRQRLGISLQRMVADDWRVLQRTAEGSLTQMIGKAASAAGLEGLLVTCASGFAGRNMVWFPANLGGKARIVIRKAEELPG